MPLNEPWKAELEDQGDPGDEQADAASMYRFWREVDSARKNGVTTSLEVADFVNCGRAIFGSTLGADTRRLIERSVVATELQEE